MRAVAECCLRVVVVKRRGDKDNRGHGSDMEANFMLGTHKQLCPFHGELNSRRVRSFFKVWDEHLTPCILISEAIKQYDTVAFLTLSCFWVLRCQICLFCNSVKLATLWLGFWFVEYGQVCSVVLLL